MLGLSMKSFADLSGQFSDFVNFIAKFRFLFLEDAITELHVSFDAEPQSSNSNFLGFLLALFLWFSWFS